MAIDLVAVLRLDDRMTASLKSVAGAATIGFAAITAAAAVSVKKFVEFDDAIRKTGAIAGASASELEALKTSALDLGASTSKSATEVANSMSELAASGMDANKVIAAMPGIIAASEASGESLAVAADVVSSSLSIWSLEAEKSTHVADVLAMAANVSAAGITDLGFAFKYAGAPAAALGISLEETAAAIGLMTNSGIDGSSAGTALRASLLALNNPAKAQAKIMDKLGFSVTDASGNFKSLSGMIGDMTKATEGLSEADKVATLAKLVGTEAVSGFLALMKAGPTELDKMTDALVNSGGAAEETAKQMMAGLGGALEEMKGAIETVAIKVGERLAPALQTFATFVSGINFDPFINAVGLVGDAAGYVANLIADNWATIGPILKPIAVIAAAVATSFLLIGGASAIFLALSAVIGFISGPIAAVAVGIGVIAGAFAVLMTKAGPVKDFFDTLKQTLSGGLFTGILERDAGAVALAITIGTGIKNAFEKVSDFITTFKQLASGGMMTGILERDEGAVATAINVFNTLKSTFATVSGFIREKIEQLTPAFESLKNTLGIVWTTISSAFSSAWSIISPVLSGLWSLLQVVGTYAAIMFNNVLVPGLAFVAQLFATLWSIAQPILLLLSAAFQVLMAVIKVLWDNVLAPLVAFITTGVKNAFEGFTEALEIVQGAFDGVSSVVSNVYDKIRDFAGFLSSVKLPSWVTEGVSSAVNFVGDVLGGNKEKRSGHYHGLANVPYDNYAADLHRGERVLTAQENKAYSNGGGSGGSGGGISIAKLADQIVVREDADINRIIDGIVTKIMERRGVTA